MNSPHSSLVKTADLPSPYQTANASGVFENPELLIIPGLPAGCAGELRLARVNVDDAGQPCDGWRVGWFLHTRQPKNTTQEEVQELGPLFRAREAAIAWLIDEVAVKFFFDHRAAKKALLAWRAQMLPKVDVPTEPACAEVANYQGPMSKDQCPTGNAQVASRYASIGCEEIEANPDNPRVAVDEEYIAELARSIMAQGLLQPVAVRDLGEQSKPRYRLIAGFCRWEAHRKLGWPLIEAKIFCGVDDARASELALVENLTRRDLNPMEEALGYCELRDRFGYSPEKIAERTGKGFSTIKNALRLAALPTAVAALVREGTLAATSARVLSAARWSQRPEHCGVLAAWIVRSRIPGDRVEQLGTGLPREAALALQEANLAVEITRYRERLGPERLAAPKQRERGPDIVETGHGDIWHLDPVTWRQEQACLDQEQREKEERERLRAVSRVEAAATQKVNVKVADLSRAKLSYELLAGDNARYVRYLPPAIVAEGIDEASAEMLVCLQPAELARLKKREAELHAADRETVLADRSGEAQDAINRLRKLGPREVAFLVAAALGDGVAATIDPKDFEERALPVPHDLTAASLALYEPLDLVKVYLWSHLVNAEGEALEEALRWVLARPVLGLAAETEEGRKKVLAQAARECFASTLTRADFPAGCECYFDDPERYAISVSCVVLDAGDAGHVQHWGKKQLEALIAQAEAEEKMAVWIRGSTDVNPETSTAQERKLGRPERLAVVALESLSMRRSVFSERKTLGL
jgi:ParB/RepB/Spo0J family partition protein